MSITFKQYIGIRKVFDNPGGDFTKLCRSIADLPDDFPSFDAVMEYFDHGMAYRRGFTAAAESVWTAFQAFNRRHEITLH